MHTFKDIKRFYNNRNSNNWNFAKHYVPEFFELKYIVHWTYGIIENFPFDDYPSPNETFENINKRVKIEQDFNVLLKNEALYKPISIKDLANKFDVPYSHETINLIQENPRICCLEKVSIEKLKDSFKKITGNSKLNLFIFESTKFDYCIADLQEEYQDITLEKYFEIQDMYDFQLNTCLFESNLNWCLTTAEDMPVLLGCKREIASEIEGKIDIELFKVENNQKMY